MPTNIGSRLNIVTNDIVCITEKDAERLKKYTVKSGDIVYSRRGDVEKCAFITPEQESVAAKLGVSKKDLSRAALEAMALEGYRSDRLTSFQVMVDVRFGNQA